MLQFNTDASLTGATARFTFIITFFLCMGLSVVHATFNLEVSQLVNNNNAYSDQGVLMEWSGSFNLNGHSYTSFGSSNFLNSPAFTNYYNAQTEHIMYFGGIGSNVQIYLEYDTDTKPGIFGHNDVVKNMFPKKSELTKHESDPNAINHSYQSSRTGNTYDSDADYIMIGDTFAIGYVEYKAGGPVESAQQIILPQGYVSGTDISGSLFFRGETLESLGLLETFGIDVDLASASSGIGANSIVLASVIEPYFNFGFEVFFNDAGNPGTSVSVDIDTSNVPEPSTYALILGGLSLIFLAFKRSRL